MTNPLIVDGEDLAMALESHNAELVYVFDRVTGEVIPTADESTGLMMDKAQRKLIKANKGKRFIPIEPVPPEEGFELMASSVT